MALFTSAPKICPACGHPATATDPLVRVDDGARIHHSHTTNPRSGYYGAAKKRRR